MPGLAPYSVRHLVGVQKRGQSGGAAGGANCVEAELLVGSDALRAAAGQWRTDSHGVRVAALAVGHADAGMIERRPLEGDPVVREGEQEVDQILPVLFGQAERMNIVVDVRVIEITPAIV